MQIDEVKRMPDGMTLKVVSGDLFMSVPVDSENSNYQEIMQQVEKGTLTIGELTIADAD
jgi:hypothetical protein